MRIIILIMALTTIAPIFSSNVQAEVSIIDDVGGIKRHDDQDMMMFYIIFGSLAAMSSIGLAYAIFSEIAYKSMLRDVLRKNDTPIQSDDDHWQVGRKYFFRMVTFYYTGVLVRVTDKEFVLENVSWIADTGRFHDALKTGDFREVEPFPVGTVIIGRGAFLDGSLFDHDLPLLQKG